MSRSSALALALLAAAALPAGAPAAAPARADLEIGGTPTVPSRVTAGATFSVRLVTRNAGRRAARATRTQVVLSRDAKRSADDAVLGTLATPGLRARGSKALAGKATVPAAVRPGTYRLLACADALRQVAESAEGDNCRVLRSAFVVLAPLGAVSPTGGSPTPAPPAPAPPAPPAPTTTTTTTPTPPTPPTPPPTGITFSANPIVLGALAYSFTNDEAIAAERLITMTNNGPGATQPISLFDTGMQDGQVADTQALGEAHSGHPACAEGMALQAGASCGFNINWRPRRRQGDLTGTLTVRVAGTATAQASVPFRADYLVRSYVSGGVPAFAAARGFKNRRNLTLTNEGDVPGAATILLNNGPGDDTRFYQDPTRTNTCTNAFPLAPGASCIIPLAFCADVATVGDQRYRSTVQLQTGGTTYLTVPLVASVTEEEMPTPCGGIFSET